MTDTFRALCAELLDEFEYQTDWSIAEELKQRARTELSSDEPAVPEGREPASVVANPSDEELDLLVIAIQALTPHQPDATTHNLAAVNRGRELLRDALTRWSRPAPAPQVEGEVAELVAWMKSQVTVHPVAQTQWAKRFVRITELLQSLASPAALVIPSSPEILEQLKSLPPGRVELLAEAADAAQALEPVPVSERPWERTGWCDEHGRCWFGAPRDGAVDAGWILRKPSERLSHQTVSLPAHALPLPSGEVNNG